MSFNIRERDFMLFDKIPVSTIEIPLSECICIW